MYPQDKAIEALVKLLEGSADKGEIYTQVAANRAMLALYARYPEEVQVHASFAKAVNRIEESTRAVAQMLGLHLAQEWCKHYDGLSKWEKFKNKKARQGWVDVHRRMLSLKAVSAVHDVLLDTYPSSLGYPEINRLFTKRDVVQMADTSYPF